MSQTEAIRLHRNLLTRAAQKRAHLFAETYRAATVKERSSERQPAWLEVYER